MKKKEILTILECCGCFACYGLVINCFGIFFTSIYKDLGISMTSLSTTITIRSMATAMAVSFVLPNIMRKTKINYIVTAGVLLSAAGYFLMSKANHALTLFAASVFIGLGMSAFSQFPISIIVKNWFSEKNGTMIGIIMASSGIAGAILNPVCSGIIENYGWRKGFLFAAAFLLIIGLPSAAFLKIAPFERSREELEQKRKSALSVSELSKLGILIMTLICVVHTSFLSVANFLPSISQSMGYSLSLSGFIVSAAMVGNIASKVLIGVLSDKTNPYFACGTIMFAAFAGMLGISLSGPSQFLVIVSAVLFGCSYSVGTTGVPLLTREVFGDRGYSAAYPMINFITLVLTSIMTMLAGKLFDLTGAYKLQLIIVSVLGVCGVLLLFLLHSGTIVLNKNSRSEKADI